MFSKLTLFTGMVLLVWATNTFGEEVLSDDIELYLHGIYSDGSVWRAAVEHRIQTTGEQALIYIPKGAREIQVELYLPGQSTPKISALTYKDTASRDHGLRRMDPLAQVAREGFAPTIIAPTMPGKGEYSWANNTKVVEAWLHGLSDGSTAVNILGNSQAGPIVLNALAKRENYGLVRNVTLIDPAFGSHLPALRQTLKGIPEISGLMPGISDGLKDNAKGSQALQGVFRQLPNVDPGTKLTVINTKNGVVNQEKMIEAVTVLQKTGKHVTVLEDPARLYKTWQPTAGFGPGHNKGFIEANQIPEFTHRGPHGARDFQKYANFETLFQGWNTGTSRLGVEGLTRHWTREFKLDGFKDLTGNRSTGLSTGEIYRIPKMLNEITRWNDPLKDLSRQINPSGSWRRGR
jgi:hypothetical protein